MAAPHVAGVAAVILQAQPTMDPGSLKDLIKRTADTSLNVAQFPAVDPVWDNDLGSGMLDAWAALGVAAATDVRFASCVGAAANPGKPCPLAPPRPSWANDLDITTASPAQVGVANTITAQVRNDGPVAATVLVNFGVYVFAVGNNQFFHIGSQQVTIPANTTVGVNQAWTPAASNHQCVQVSIDFGLDTDFGNNVTQCNIQVAPSVFQVQIENPFMVPADLEIRPRSDREGWKWEVSEQKFRLDPFEDCPRQIRVTFDPPEGAPPGEMASCDVAVFATPEGTETPLPIGGVTVRTFVPRRCRVVGEVVDPAGKPLRGASLVFAEQRGDPRRRAAVTVVTDDDGVFSAQLTPHVEQRVTLEKPGVGKGEITVRALCGVGTLKFVLSREGVKLLRERIGRTWR